MSNFSVAIRGNLFSNVLEGPGPGAKMLWAKAATAVTRFFRYRLSKKKALRDRVVYPVTIIRSARTDPAPLIYKYIQVLYIYMYICM